MIGTGTPAHALQHPPGTAELPPLPGCEEPEVISDREKVTLAAKTPGGSGVGEFTQREHKRHSTDLRIPSAEIPYFSRRYFWLPT